MHLQANSLSERKKQFFSVPFHTELSLSKNNVCLFTWKVLSRKEVRFMPSIQIATSSPVIEFAAEELKRYLAMLPGVPSLPIRLYALDMENDGFTVDVDFSGRGGFIKGSNPRSVLFAVYRLLEGLGFRWVRPGKDGEIIPSAPQKWPYLCYWEQACVNFRGICIEGANSRENLLDMVDWMAKHRMNTYRQQAPSAYPFLKRWYTHAGNPKLAPEPIDLDMAQKITLELISEIKKRGMYLLEFGHGPTSEIVGLSGWGWDPEREPVRDNMKQYFAEINGVRELWHGHPVNTQLCYGNPEVRQRLLNRVVEQVMEHPEADVINFFLSDHHHNQCECQLCVSMLPVEHYIHILNEIDAELSKRGIKTKIAFAVYIDTLWPSTEVRIVNPERFIIWFCPFTRSYSTPLAAEGVGSKTPEYMRNISPYPSDGKNLLAFLKKWQEVFSGTVILFDYHYMWEVSKERGAYSLPAVLHADCQSLPALDISGFMSCQNQRVFYPNGLGMTAMAAALWHLESDFDTVAWEYFHDAFGAGAEEAQNWFRNISELLDMPVLRGEQKTPERRRSAIAKLKRLSDEIRKISPYLQIGKSAANQVQRESWEILAFHTEEMRLFVRVLEKLWTGKVATTEIQQLFDWVRRHEMRLQAHLDVFEYLLTLIDVFGIERAEFFDQEFNEVFGEI
jgi:hypothetical protein